MDHNKIHSDVFFNKMKGFTNILYVLMVEDFGYISHWSRAKPGLNVEFSKKLGYAITRTEGQIKCTLSEIMQYRKFYLVDADDENEITTFLTRKTIKISIKKMHCAVEDYNE